MLGGGSRFSGGDEQNTRWRAPDEPEADRPPHEPGAVKIVDVPFGDDLDGVTFGAAGAAGVGTGGAGTKVAAARFAAEAGTPVLVTSTGNVARALAGDHVGTFFEAADATSAAERSA